MKDQYVGDIGDYGKYGLLRFLANHGLIIGVNWYRTEKDCSNDGRFTDYLKKTEDRKYDPILYDALKEIAFQDNKSVQLIEDANLIRGARYYNRILINSGLKPTDREIRRRIWFDQSIPVLTDADLIFADPDNGISFRKNSREADSVKYILPLEISNYYALGKNVAYYCHKGRRKMEAWEAAKTGILSYIPEARILVLTYHRGTQRSYIFVVHPEDFQVYDALLNRFLGTKWGKLFSRETVSR